MRAIHTWMFIAATILIGLAAGFAANAQEFRVRVTTKDNGSNYYAVTSDKRLLAVVCRYNILESAWKLSATYSADLVFPNDEGVLDLEYYRDASNARSSSVVRSAYRPLSAGDAKKFCESPLGEFVLRVNDETAELSMRREVTVQSFGVERRSL